MHYWLLFYQSVYCNPEIFAYIIGEQDTKINTFEIFKFGNNFGYIKTFVFGMKQKQKTNKKKNHLYRYLYFIKQQNLIILYRSETFGMLKNLVFGMEQKNKKNPLVCVFYQTNWLFWMEGEFW